MATVTLHQFQFRLDNAVGGSLTDYSGQVTKVEVPVEIMSATHHTFASRDANATVGGKKTTIKATVRVETTASSLYGILMAIAHSATLATYNGTLSYSIGTPDTSTTGSHVMSGECKVTKIGSPLKAEAGKGEIQTVDVELTTDGTVTYAVA